MIIYDNYKNLTVNEFITRFFHYKNLEINHANYTILGGDRLKNPNIGSSGYVSNVMLICINNTKNNVSFPPFDVCHVINKTQKNKINIVDTYEFGIVNGKSFMINLLYDDMTKLQKNIWP